MLVSVILTVFDRDRFLREAIESVLNQTMSDFELIIAEDESGNPKVRSTIQEYLADSRVSHVSSFVEEARRYDTARYATNINMAIKECATGKYITYLTDDDLFYPHRLAVMSEALESNPEWHIVYSSQAVVDENGRQSGVRKLKGDLDFAFDRVDHNSVMHTRSSYDSVGGWPDSKGTWGGADGYFWRKLNDAGYIFHAIGSDEDPLDAKRYHKDAVQWKIANGIFFPKDKK